MKRIIIYILLIGFIVGGKHCDNRRHTKALCEAWDELDEKNRIIESIKIDGVNEEYDGQIVIELDGEFYEYKYTTEDSEKDFICKW